MATSLPDEAPKEASFCGIAQELRNEIYSYLLIARGVQQPYTTHGIICLNKSRFVMSNSYDVLEAPKILQNYCALSMVSRKIREEVCGIFWTSNRFEISPDPGNCLSLVRDLMMVVNLAGMTDPVRGWMQNCHVSLDLRKNGRAGALKVTLRVHTRSQDRDVKDFDEELSSEFGKDMEHLDGVVAGKTALNGQMIQDIIERCDEMRGRLDFWVARMHK